MRAEENSGEFQRVRESSKTLSVCPFHRWATGELGRALESSGEPLRAQESFRKATGELRRAQGSHRRAQD
eukprot:1853983-Alexandrium_andersonii.AAC.1